MSYVLYEDDFTTLDRIAWAGIVRDEYGNPVCDVWNHGDFDCNRYAWANELAKIEFTSEAKSNHPESFEPLDDYIVDLWRLQNE